MGVHIQKSIGQIPDLWQKNVIFFGNLLSLFYGNAEETKVLRQEVGALETYGSRLIPIINLMYQAEDNLLVLDKEPESQLITYFSQSLQLKLPQIATLAHNDYLAITSEEQEHSEEMTQFLHKLHAHSAQTIDGYIVDDVLMRIAEITGKSTTSSSMASRKANNKLLLHELLKEKQLPVFDTYVAHKQQEVQGSLMRLKSKGYSFAVVKSQIGASGIGILKIPTYEITSTVPEYMFFEGPCMVQGWLDDLVDGVKMVGSPSVQLFLLDDKIIIHDLTEQILSKESVHEGNVSPPPYILTECELKDELIHQAEIVSQWLHELGFRGPASCDFHVTERKGKAEVRLCEVNARVTGATYPSLIAHHFAEGGVWLLRNIRFDPAVESEKVLGILDEKKLLFHAGKPAGILPFNFNTNVAGNVVKGQFLFLGSSINEVKNLLNEMIGIKELNGGYDRD